MLIRFFFIFVSFTCNGIDSVYNFFTTKYVLCNESELEKLILKTIEYT